MNRLNAVVVAITTLAACGQSAPDRQRTDGGLRTSVFVNAFVSRDGAPLKWKTSVFTDSLASTLGRVSGLKVHTPADPARDRIEYVLTGDVAVEHNRVIVTSRLARSGDTSVIWSASIWRNEGPVPTLVPDVAAAVAEAIFADVARHEVFNERVR